MSDPEARLRAGLRALADLAPVDVPAVAPGGRSRPALAAAAAVVAVLAGALVLLPEHGERLTEAPPAGRPAVTAVASPPREPSAVPSRRPPPATRGPAHAVSATFVSARTGWLLVDGGSCGGAACRRRLLRTDDGGRTFTRLPLPPAPVTQVRFGSDDDGWAFGQDVPSPGNGLWRTIDGGRHWELVLPHPVTSLEVTGGVAWAVVLSDDETTPALWRARATGNAWQQVRPIPNRSAVLAASDRVYVLAVQGAGPIPPSVVVASASGTGLREAPPCPEGQQPDLLAAGRGRVAVACAGDPSAGAQRKTLWTSSDGARTWRQEPEPPVSGYLLGGSLGLTDRAVFLTGARNAVQRLDPDGRWRPVLRDDRDAGFTFVGFVDDRHGVALSPAGTWHTTDGGTTWTRLTLL